MKTCSKSNENSLFSWPAKMQHLAEPLEDLNMLAESVNLLLADFARTGFRTAKILPKQDSTGATLVHTGPILMQ